MSASAFRAFKNEWLPIAEAKATRKNGFEMACLYIRLTERQMNGLRGACEFNGSPNQKFSLRRGGLMARVPSVCVIIPAWNAAATIARAVQSALAQAEVHEVIVVDDCSADETSTIASDCDSSSGRLKVLRQTRNLGPSAARNLAIGHSTADCIAVLDADDFLLPERFAPMLKLSGWDMIADNMVFVPEAGVDAFDASRIALFDAVPDRIGLAEFIDGNVSRPGRPRAELGFAKPVIRRAFIESHGLRYDESMRLGEDYALYTRALALGAVFLRIRHCGYVAVERSASLSGQHATADLEALLAFDRSFANSAILTSQVRAALRRHMQQTEVKVGHRVFLDTKRANGLAHAVGNALKNFGTLPGITAAILRDKLPFARQTPAPGTKELRYLFP